METKDADMAPAGAETCEVCCRIPYLSAVKETSVPLGQKDA